MGFEFKARTEILACYDVLTIWPDKFSHLGKLISLDHLSNPDDPPDVRANFDSGAVMDMEHTSILAQHQRWAENLMGGCGGVAPPASGKYETREELLSVINPWGGGGWASVEEEAQAHHNLIFEAMKRKIEAHPDGGVMVPDGHYHGSDYALPPAIKAAFMDAPLVPGAEKWTYCFISRSNSIDYYSTIFSPTIDYAERRPPRPDPS